MHNLSQNLKHLIIKAKISENELSRRTGVPQQVINRIMAGKNLNPKIATLMPLAEYFSISLSQLLGEQELSRELKLNIQHMGWGNLPLLNWHNIGPTSVEKLIEGCTKKIVVDIHNTGNIFVTKMVDNSMEPKFTHKTLLIFDSKKPIHDKDFLLIFSNTTNELALRQIFIKKTGCYQKCFNPDYSDFKPGKISSESIYIGVLIQSRTEHYES